MLDAKIKAMTANLPPFIQYGKGKTLYKVYVFKKEEMEYLLYYDAALSLRKVHVLILPKK